MSLINLLCLQVYFMWQREENLLFGLIFICRTKQLNPKGENTSNLTSKNTRIFFSKENFKMHVSSLLLSYFSLVLQYFVPDLLLEREEPYKLFFFRSLPFSCSDYRGKSNFISLHKVFLLVFDMF